MCFFFYQKESKGLSSTAPGGTDATAAASRPLLSLLAVPPAVAPGEDGGRGLPLLRATLFFVGAGAVAEAVSLAAASPAPPAEVAITAAGEAAAVEAVPLRGWCLLRVARTPFFL